MLQKFKEKWYLAGKIKTVYKFYRIYKLIDTSVVEGKPPLTQLLTFLAQTMLLGWSYTKGVDGYTWYFYFIMTSNSVFSFLNLFLWNLKRN